MLWAVSQLPGKDLKASPLCTHSFDHHLLTHAFARCFSKSPTEHFLCCGPRTGGWSCRGRARLFPPRGQGTWHGGCYRGHPHLLRAAPPAASPSPCVCSGSCPQQVQQTRDGPACVLAAVSDKTRAPQACGSDAGCIRPPGSEVTPSFPARVMFFLSEQFSSRPVSAET